MRGDGGRDEAGRDLALPVRRDRPSHQCRMCHCWWGPIGGSTTSWGLEAAINVMDVRRSVDAQSGGAADAEFMALVGWVVQLVAALDPFGVGLLLAIDDVFPIIPSEVVLPFAGISPGTRCRST